MTKHYFRDVPPARGHWIQPGTDAATIGRKIVGNAMREFLARHPEESATMTTTTDAQRQREAARQEWIERRQGQATIDSAYEKYMAEKVAASKPLSPDAASSYRRDLGTSDAQAQRDKAHADFLARRHGGGQ
ncbi:hypothetical protein RSO68_03445 [Halomonas saccharevitans]|uniref:Uncharacterized protein n=1 Tax=Halomonas saccharevitans TaxID=416872 RepID=A0ABU3ND09_9GAMM|nr:hypothetical protein [Halomonas saccharevitans]MDT8878520.1 hypothetical protein [Halomonas saccharevitans]